MKTAAIELLCGVLLIATVLALGWTLNHRLARANQRAATAEATAHRLQGELDQARMSERVITQYVDRVRVVREHGATILQKVPVYVTAQADAVCPIPVGFVRLHDSAAQNLPLGAPTDNPDAPAPGVALSTVASTVAGNYTTCHETAQQLTALQDWVRGLQAIETP